MKKVYSNGESLGISDAYYVRLQALATDLWKSENTVTAKTENYSKIGYHVGDIPVEFRQDLFGFFDVEPVSFSADDVAEGYIFSDLEPNTVDMLNNDNIYFPIPGERPIRGLTAFLEAIKAEIEEHIGFYWRPINVRAWKAKPQATGGPANWHHDGYPSAIKKIMIYPNAPNSENGTLEIKARDGTTTRLERSEPSYFFGDVGELDHRAIPPTNRLRPAIEVTLVPHLTTVIAPIFAGQNARVPFPDERLVRQLDRRWPTPFSFRGVNIGGGPTFQSPGWINLDAVAAGREAFSLSPSAVLPLADASIDLVYSSHCLEHLDDATVHQVLMEARRVLQKHGHLLLKIPDFERTIRSWKSNDSAFFSDDNWGFGQVSKTWSRKGVVDDIASRASMIFCGYWNPQYGDHFRHETNVFDPASYHGPAPLPRRKVARILKSGSPHEIAQALRQHVQSNEPHPTFNHQNAWSQAEFDSLLVDHGFKVLTWDGEDLCRAYVGIPDIGAMQDISLYCLAARLETPSSSPTPIKPSSTGFSRALQKILRRRK